MVHLELFAQIICLSSGFPVIALATASYMKGKNVVVKYLAFNMALISLQLIFAVALHYLEINILNPVSHLNLILTLLYFIFEALFIFSGPVFYHSILGIPNVRKRNLIFATGTLIAFGIIVSPFIFRNNSNQPVMFGLPGLLTYRLLLYATIIYLVVMVGRNIKQVAENSTRIFLYTFLAFNVFTGIETLSCKLMPVLKFHLFGFPLAPVIYLGLNFFLLKHFIEQLAQSAELINIPNMDQFLERSKITVREQEIITLLLEGFHNREIAKQLYISESTVKTHIKSIYRKLKIKNRIQLVNLMKNNC